MYCSCTAALAICTVRPICIGPCPESAPVLQVCKASSIALDLSTMKSTEQLCWQRGSARDVLQKAPHGRVGTGSLQNVQCHLICWQPDRHQCSLQPYMCAWPLLACLHTLAMHMAARLWMRFWIQLCMRPLPSAPFVRQPADMCTRPSNLTAQGCRGLNECLYAAASTC